MDTLLEEQTLLCLKAMASNSLICSHKDIFNSSILNNDAIYFLINDELIHAIEFCHKSNYQNFCSNNLYKIEKHIFLGKNHFRL